MDHKLSKIKVYVTDDYKRFEFIKGNRKTNKTKQENIMADIDSGNDILDESPVLVKEVKNKLRVLDGQNRVQICEALSRPVHYIIKEADMSLYNLAKVNSNVEKWKGVDFINCYREAGNENYIQLDKFYKKYHFGIGVCLSLLTYGTQKNDGGGHELIVAFQQGTFEVKTYKEAVQFAEVCKSFSAFTGWTGRGFVIAIQKIIQADKCEFDVLIKKFNYNPKRLQHQSNWKGYMANLEEIYNIDNSKRRVIF